MWRQKNLMDAISNKSSARMETKISFFIGWLDVSLADDWRGISGNNNLSVEISNGYSATQERNKIWRHKYKQAYQMECFPTGWIYLSGWGPKKKQTKKQSEVDISPQVPFFGCNGNTFNMCRFPMSKLIWIKKQKTKTKLLPTVGSEGNKFVFWAELLSCLITTTNPKMSFSTRLSENLCLKSQQP